MPHAELERLDLLAQVDALEGRLERWSAAAPPWPPAAGVRALIERLRGRTDKLRVRLETPLVVATFGGTGTGKSTLVNALCGSEVTQPGRQRPTTRTPTLICRPDLAPEMLGIDPRSVQVAHRDLPALRDLVLLDCPDPDTSEDAEAPGSNLARLRQLLPVCDVLLVCTTQQKYRSARVADELLSAAGGARLVFVQTHADQDDDIRADWARLLEREYAPGEMYLVDSLAALADAQAGVAPRGEFGRLVDLLTRELAGAAGSRIRRANYLDLVEETLRASRERLDAALPAVEQTEAGIQEQRARLAARLAEKVRDELTGSQRTWEARLVGEIASRWGFSPFACLLRLYAALGDIVSGGLLLRARSPAQLALWGAFETGRRWKRSREENQASAAPLRALAFGDEGTELRTAAIIVEGYAAEAGLDRADLRPEALERQAEAVGGQLVTRVAADVEQIVRRHASRHATWLVRSVYELALGGLLALLVWRFGKNFFWDSWLGFDFGVLERPAPLLGVDFFLGALVVLLAFSGLLLWLFTGRLRRGLRQEVRELAQSWTSPAVAGQLFGGLEARCREVRDWRFELERMEREVDSLRARLSLVEPRLGHKIG